MSTGKITKVIRVKETTIPPGKYAAQWCGYRITIKLDNGEIWMSTENGVRGWVDGTVTVDETGVISWSNDPDQPRP